MAAKLELKDSLMMIYEFINGQAYAYQVMDALRHLDYVCCSQLVRRETEKIRQCVYWDDDTAREHVCKEAFGAIISYLDNNGTRMVSFE